MRKIIFNNIDSLADLGLTIDSELTVIGDPPPNFAEEKIPNRNGVISYFMDYDPRKLTYVFNIIGSSLTALEAKRSQLKNAFMGHQGDLYDTAFPGWRFTNARITAPPELTYNTRNFRTAKLTVEFTADPLMESTAGVRSQIITLAGRAITAYILANAVLCTGYTYPESPQMTVQTSGTSATLTFELDSSFAGLRCFDVSGTPDLTLTGGSVGGNSVTLAGAHNGFVNVPASGGTLTLTAVLTGESTLPYIVIAFGAGLAFAHDSAKHYRMDDYSVGTHTLTVNGASAEFSGFTVGGEYDTIEIVGSRETDVYKLWYDSVEVSL